MTHKIKAHTNNGMELDTKIYTHKYRLTFLHIHTHTYTYRNKIVYTIRQTIYEKQGLKNEAISNLVVTRALF